MHVSLIFSVVFVENLYLFVSDVFCEDGSISVSAGHWMGFDGDSIISGVCPLGMCCQPDGGDSECDFIENKASLCADNRDYESPLSADNALRDTLNP